MGIPSTEKGAPRIGLIHLWGIAVGSSVGGDFVGWNGGLSAGVGGALVGLCVSTLLYGTLSLSIAEMGAHSAKLGGSYTFVGESPLGRLGAFVTGIAELLKLLPTGAAFALGIQSYLAYCLEMGVPTTPGLGDAGVLLMLYLVFTWLNIRGLEISANAQLGVTVASIAILVIFYVLALPAIDFQKYALDGGNGWFTGGWANFFSALPYSLEYYLGLESVPLLANSVQNPGRVMPRAILYSMATLGIIGVLTLILNSSVAPGVQVLQQSSAPLLEGFKALTQSSLLLGAAAALISSGLIVGFHVFVLYAGETVAMLAKDAILPAWLGALHPQHGTPHAALLGSSAVGLALLAVTAYALPPSTCMSVLINMAVAGALVSYQLQFLAYLSRPWYGTTGNGGGFRSPLGRAGAYAGLCASSLLLASQVVHASQDRAEAAGLAVAAAVFVIALASYRWGPAQSSRAAKAARAARTHADSLAESINGVGDRGAVTVDEEESARRPLLDYEGYLHGRPGVGAASTPQRRKGNGAGLWGKGLDVVLTNTPVTGGGALWCDV